MIHIKLIIMALLWAGGFISSKLIVTQAGPLTISFLRFFVVTCILAVLVFRTEKSIRLDGRLLAYAFGAGLIGTFCYNYLFFYGMKLIDASRGSVIIGTVPIAVAVFSYMFLKEKLSAVRAVGIVVSVIGAWVVVSKGHLGAIAGNNVGWGELCLILCVFCATAFVLFSKMMLQELKPVVVMFYISALSTALMCVPAVIEMQRTPAQVFAQGFWLNLFYLAIGPSVVAVVFYYEAISLVGATRASQYMNLIPVFAVVMATVFLGEPLTSSLVVGGGLVTTGLYLANMSS